MTTLAPGEEPEKSNLHKFASGGLPIRSKMSQFRNVWQHPPKEFVLYHHSAILENQLGLFFYAILILAALEISRRIVYSMIRLRNEVVVEQKMTELKLSFFTNISHELRTPPTLIVNPINEIAKNEKLSPLGQDYIETVQKNTNRLVRFVNQLLDFRKVQSGNEELRIKPWNWCPL